MIDVHILTMPNDNLEWFAQCLASLKNEPVCVYQMDGKLDDIGNARADAFKQGDNEYVSFVDPDDYVLPGGFKACVDQINKDNSFAACTQEIITGFRGELTKNPIIKDWVHHLIVMKRDVVLKHIDVWKNWNISSRISEGRFFVNYLKTINKPISYIKKPYYVWRKHLDSYTSRRRNNGRLD